MKQDKIGQLERCNQLIQLGENVFSQVKPMLIETKDEYDDRINLSERVTKEIKDKREKIRKIDEHKDEIILKIIGQLYNGTLIPNELSFRKGKIHKFKCRYELSLDNVKGTIMKHLQEVATKLTKNSLDILEFVLQKKYESPESHITNSNYSPWYNNKGSGDNRRKKVIRFPELKIIEMDKDDIAEKHLQINFINGVVIEDDGDVNFFYEYKEENGELKVDYPSLDSDTFAGLYIKFEKEIKENASVFIQDLDTEIANAEKEIAEIKDKGQNQLALCELLNTGEDFIKNEN